MAEDKFPYKIIDLTHALDSTIPTWNGGCGFNHDVHIDYSDCTSEDKFRVMKVKMHAGIGTHMDAPSHCIPSGRFIHDFEVNDLIMPCVVIDVQVCPELFESCVMRPCITSAVKKLDKFFLTSAVLSRRDALSRKRLHNDWTAHRIFFSRLHYTLFNQRCSTHPKMFIKAT